MTRKQFKPRNPRNEAITQNIVLVGFMGCGKTTIARRLAREFGLKLVDTDELIVERAGGRSIPQIFAEEGEESFRRRETAVLQSLANQTGLVISTGGGIVTREENRSLLRSLGCVIWLTADTETVWERVRRHTGRPLLQTADPKQSIAAMLEERAPLYQSVASGECVNTSNFTIEEITYGLAETIRCYFTDQKAGSAAIS